MYHLHFVFMPPAVKQHVNNNVKVQNGWNDTHAHRSCWHGVTRHTNPHFSRPPLGEVVSYPMQCAAVRFESYVTDSGENQSEGATSAIF